MSSSDLSALSSLSESDLAALLARNADFLKKTQAALVQAKRLEAERKAREEAAARGEQPFDEKSFERAKRLVCGPANDETKAALRALAPKLNLSFAPEGSKTLMATALDYLTSKERVELTWPSILRELGAPLDAPAAEIMVSLYRSRSGSLGSEARSFLLWGLRQDLPWADVETSLREPSKTLAGSGLLDFLMTQRGGGEWGVPEWDAVSNLVESGVRAPSNSTNTSYISYHSAAHGWEQLLSRPAAAAEQGSATAKARAFSLMIERGWCDEGIAPVWDNLTAPNGSEARIPNAGSRTMLAFAALDSALLDIFQTQCEREDRSGSFSRYDELGRSRLYFINERLRQSSRNDATSETLLLSLAKVALQRGDPPASVNAQYPLAKASTKAMRGLLSSALERDELHGIQPAAAPRSVSKPRRAL